MQYCPTDEMIADFFTKPLGGAKFRRFRNIIMNCSHDDYGPVNVDALMASHYKRTSERDASHPAIKDNDSEKENEPTIAKDMSSQECVGKDPVRKDTRGSDRRGALAPRTWAQVAAVAE